MQMKILFFILTEKDTQTFTREVNDPGKPSVSPNELSNIVRNLVRGYDYRKIRAAFAGSHFTKRQEYYLNMFTKYIFPGILFGFQ
jgi:hypothetical protein